MNKCLHYLFCIYGYSNKANKAIEEKNRLLARFETAHQAELNSVVEYSQTW